MWGGASACGVRRADVEAAAGVVHGGCATFARVRLVSGGENNETYFTCHAKQVKLRVKRAANIEEYILAPGTWDGAQRQDGIMGYTVNKEPSALFMWMCYLV